MPNKREVLPLKSDAKTLNIIVTKAVTAPLRQKYFWSSEGRSFVMRSLNPCPENFSQNVVYWGKLLRWGGGGGGGVIYQTKLEVLDLLDKIGKLEVLEANPLFRGGGGNLLDKIGSA